MMEFFSLMFGLCGVLCLILAAENYSRHKQLQGSREANRHLRENLSEQIRELNRENAALLSQVNELSAENERLKDLQEQALDHVDRAAEALSDPEPYTLSEIDEETA